VVVAAEEEFAVLVRSYHEGASRRHLDDSRSHSGEKSGQSTLVVDPPDEFAG